MRAVFVVLGALGHDSTAQNLCSERSGGLSERGMVGEHCVRAVLCPLCSECSSNSAVRNLCSEDGVLRSESSVFVVDTQWRSEAI